MKPLSEQILQRQLVMLGRVALSPEGSPLKKNVFVDDSLNLEIERYIQRRGRPRQTWSTEVLSAAKRLLGAARVEQLLRDRSPGAEHRWNNEVKRVCS